MFVRFRQSGSRLQASLIETRRADGRVRHQHIASLGSIATPLTVADRIAFWSRLHERLAKLDNRLDGEAQAKALGAVHARIPMVTADEQRALQLANAEGDERFWTGMHDINSVTAEGNKSLAATVASKIANAEAAAADAAAKAAAAKDRVARIERGEDVAGGLSKPMTTADLLKAGITKAEIERFVRVHQVSNAFGFDAMAKAIRKATDRAERRTLRALHRLTPERK